MLLSIDLSDGELGLTDFEIYHTISNVNSLKNLTLMKITRKFHSGRIIRNNDINEYLRCAILQSRPNDTAREKRG